MIQSFGCVVPQWQLTNAYSYSTARNHDDVRDYVNGEMTVELIDRATYSTAMTGHETPRAEECTFVSRI
jgi:hypothetical protein